MKKCYTSEKEAFNLKLVISFPFLHAFKNRIFDLYDKSLIMTHVICKVLLASQMPSFRTPGNKSHLHEAEKVCESEGDWNSEECSNFLEVKFQFISIPNFRSITASSTMRCFALNDIQNDITNAVVGMLTVPKALLSVSRMLIEKNDYQKIQDTHMFI